MRELKKLVCAILSAVMVISSLTVVSFATDGYTEVSTAAAVQGAFVSGANAKLRLTADVTLTAQIVGHANENVTIDLNGHKLTGKSSTRVYYNTADTANLTIEDSVGTGKVITQAGSSYGNGGAMFYTQGALTIKGGQMSGGATTNKGAYIYVTGTGGIVTISGGRMEDGGGTGTANIYVNGASKCYISGGYIGKASDNRSIWAYTGSGTKAQVHISGDPIITGTVWPATSYFITFTGGYYAKDMSSLITDKTNYKQITLPIAKEGCKYKVTKNNATIKYYDGDTEYTTLGNTPSAGTNSTIAAAQTKDGYNFVSWNTQADGEGDTYQPGASFFVEGDLTLYAQWVSATAKTYDIKYYDGDDEYTTLAETVEEGVKFNIEDAQEKTNYIFKEWNTSKEGTGDSYAAGAEVTASKDLTLYAIWDKAVASVNHAGTTTYYSDFSAAVSAEILATSDGTSATITLMDDITVSSKIAFSSNSNVSLETIKRTTNLDFNGYTITTSAADAFAVNKYAKVNFYDNSSSGTGGVIMTASNNHLLYSPGWSGTQFSIYGGNYSGVVNISNYGYNINSATRLYGGSYNTLSCSDGVSPLVPNETSYEKIGDTYCVGKAAVSVDGATKVFASFESARSYLVANNDAGETGIIKLLGNVAVSARINLYTSWSQSNEMRTVIFDLNGFTLSSTKALSDGIITQNCFDVTYIKDTSDAKTGKIAMYEGSGYYFHTPRYTTNKYYISDITMTGGSQIGPDAALGSTNYYNIISGTYNFDPSPYMSDKTKTALDNGDGTWTIIDAPYIVTYSDETQAYFATYQLALDSILAKADMTGTVKVAIPSLDATFALDAAGADVTIDLNGQTVAMAINIPFADVKAGKLTISNGTINLEGKTDDAAKIAVAKGAILALDSVNISGATTPIESSGITIIDGAVATSGLVNQLETAVVADTISGTVSDEIKFTVRAYVATTLDNPIVTMKYISNGTEKTANGTALGDGEYEFVTEAGITLINIDKNLAMTFYVDGDEISGPIEMSVQRYFDRVHELESNNNTQNAFMAETTDFGAKLQAYNDGTATIVLSDWMNEYLIKTSPSKSDDIKATIIGTSSPETNKIKNAYLSISDKVRLVLIVNASEGTKLSVALDDVDVYEKTFEEAGTDTVALDKISPTQYSDKYIITLRSSDQTILHQVSYSINSYAFVKKDDAVVGEVANAMYCYGLAADAIKIETEVDFDETYYAWSNYSTTCTATRKSTDGTVTQTETVDVVKTTKTAESGVVAAVEINTADFVNPAFTTQVTTAPKVKEANLTGSKTQIAYEKHLILNSDGSYGGNYDEDTYGAGAPKNGANDHVDAGYYAINDYYNTKCTDTRTILTGFKPYQQTMEYTDGIASVLMALNYFDDTFASTYSEKDLLDKYEELTGATVYGNGTTGAGLKTLVENLGYTADTTAKATDKAAFQTLVESTLKAGKIMLLKWQQAEKSRWVVVVGFDGMGNAENNSDVLILGIPYDAYDHYQDGYQVQTITTFYAWWRDQRTTGCVSSHDILIINPKEPITLQYEEAGVDNIKTNPYTPERHLLLNSNGTAGGALNTSLYGSGTAYNGTYGGRYTDAPEYNYYGKKDYYNAVDTDTLTICEKFPVFQQTMASSCGICSTLNTLNYLGYDFTKLDNYVTDRPTQSGYVVGSIHTGGDYDKVQEALVNIYMQGDTYFNDSTKKFNNYGGVGAWRLIKIGEKLGLTGSYSNFDVKDKETPKFTTFTSFKNYIVDRLDNNLPLIICWNPGSGHWETIIGYDDMGTSTVFDDVIVLADSADSHDQYQDGYNTYPARQFFGQWYNGSCELGQPMVAYNAYK